MRIQFPDGLFCMHRHGNVPRGSPARKSEQLIPSLFIQALISFYEQFPAAVEGITLVATPSHGLVLHPSAALIELGICPFDYLNTAMVCVAPTVLDRELYDEAIAAEVLGVPRATLHY